MVINQNSNTHLHKNDRKYNMCECLLLKPYYLKKVEHRFVFSYLHELNSGCNVFENPV